MYSNFIFKYIENSKEFIVGISERNLDEILIDDYFGEKSIYFDHLFFNCLHKLGNCRGEITSQSACIMRAGRSNLKLRSTAIKILVVSDVAFSMHII